jgi:hypothetical protein
MAFRANNLKIVLRGVATKVGSKWHFGKAVQSHVGMQHVLLYVCHDLPCPRNERSTSSIDQRANDIQACVCWRVGPNRIEFAEIERQLRTLRTDAPRLSFDLLFDTREFRSIGIDWFRQFRILAYQDPRLHARGIARHQLLQLCVLGFGLNQDRDVRVGILP